MYLPTQVLTHILLLLIPCLLLLSATPSPSPNPYPAAVALPSFSQHRTRQLYDAKPVPVELSHDLLDYVIISTIDGALQAVERDGGKVKWSLRDGVSPLVGGQIKGKGEDEYIVEPLSGVLYVFEGEDSQSVRKLPLSVEQLIELSPFTFPHSPSRIFTGSKHTSLMTIDLRTGQQLDCFSTLSENNTETCVCETDRLLDDMEGHARSNSDILFVGRTDYRLVIHSPLSSSVYSASTGASAGISNRRPGYQEISYSTYTPNMFDKPIAEYWLKASQVLAEDSEEISSTRIELGHDGIAVGVAHGGGVKWMKDLGSIGIGVYDILLPMTPSTAKPIIVPQPPPRLESLFPMPANPEKSHTDIHTKSPTTYIGSVPYQLTLAANDSDETRPSALRDSDKPLLFALSSASYPLINFAPQAKPGSQANGSFPLSDDLPAKDQLLPQLLDPADEDKTIDPAPETVMQGLRRKERASRSWIFWVIGVLATLVMAGVAIAGLGQRKLVKQTASPPSEKEPLLISDAFKPASPKPVKAKLKKLGNSSPPSGPKQSEQGLATGDKKKKKSSNRRRQRGKKKQPEIHNALEAQGAEESLFDDEDSDDDDENDYEESVIGSPMPPSDKPLPELPRAISTTALENENDKERLVISDKVIGHGSDGTVVLKGTWGIRPVAVKRLVNDFTRIASQEVKLLQSSDDHPNVIRYYCQERRENFLYIALDLCQASLEDIVSKPSSHPELVQLFDTKRALSQVTKGLKHLHSMNIIHRDIKPQNVLVARGADGDLRMVVSDFGLARRLEQDQSSYAPTGNNLAGTKGWRAPECILGLVRLNEGFERESNSSASSSGSIVDMVDAETTETPKDHARLTKAVDLFALGCVYFWTAMGGQHPFGDKDYQYEGNIVKGIPVNMRRVEEMQGLDGVQLDDLVRSLVSLDPASRPKTLECLNHPYFWQPEKRLRFLCDASDRFDFLANADSGSQDPTLIALETGAVEIVGKDWNSRLDKSVASSLRTHRKYRGDSVRDLLRAMRNKRNHYHDLDEVAKKNIGELPAGFLDYFCSRNPKLFLQVYKVIKYSELGQESMFESYITPADS